MVIRILSNQRQREGAKHFKLTIHSPPRAQSRFVQDLSRLLPMRSSGFQMGCPEVESYFDSRFLISLSWLVSSKSTSLSFASFEAHSTFAFLFFFRFLAFLCLVLVPIVHGVQLWSFDFLKNCLAEGVPVRVQSRSLETVPIWIVVPCFQHNNIADTHLYDECIRSNTPNVCHKILSILCLHGQVCSQTTKI